MQKIKCAYFLNWVHQTKTSHVKDCTRIALVIAWNTELNLEFERLNSIAIIRKV